MLPWLKNTCINYNYPLVNSHSYGKMPMSVGNFQQKASQQVSLESISQYIRYLHEFHIFHIYIYGTLWFSISSIMTLWFPENISMISSMIFKISSTISTFFDARRGPVRWCSPFQKTPDAPRRMSEVLVGLSDPRSAWCGNVDPKRNDDSSDLFNGNLT